MVPQKFEEYIYAEYDNAIMPNKNEMVLHK